MDNPWPSSDAFAACNEGRACELSRRATFLVLFSREGRPGTWLMVLAGLWGVIAATTLGGIA